MSQSAEVAHSQTSHNGNAHQSNSAKPNSLNTIRIRGAIEISIL